MEIYRFVICEARHLHPEINNLPAIFSTVVNPMDFTGMCHYACDSLRKTIELGVDVELNIYVTGLTSALIATINAARTFVSIKNIIVWHYDRDANKYRPQVVS